MVNRSLHSDQRHTRLSSWVAAVLDEELVVVGAVEGAGVAPLDAELDEPVADAAAGVDSGCADDMAANNASLAFDWWGWRSPKKRMIGR